MKRKFDVGDIVRIKAGKRNKCIYKWNGYLGTIKRVVYGPDYIIRLKKDDGKFVDYCLSGHNLELIKKQNLEE